VWIVLEMSSESGYGVWKVLQHPQDKIVALLEQLYQGTFNEVYGDLSYAK